MPLERLRSAAERRGFWRKKLAPYNRPVLKSSLRVLRAQPLPETPPPVPLPPPEEARERLSARFIDPRTLASFVLVIGLIAFALTRARLDYGHTLSVIRQVHPLLYAAAFAAFYLSFAVRAVRWRLLLANSGEDGPLPGLWRVLMVAWFANCLLPAKMGDLYRAHVLRRMYPISGSKGLGTVVTERFIDFGVLMAMLLGSGLIAFRSRVPRVFVPALAAGVVLALANVGILLIARFSRGQLTRFLPAALAGRLRRFKAGLLDSLGPAASLATLLAMTAAVWLLESARLFLVVHALPLHFTVSLPQVIFIALVASLLTTIPALPGGLILVEGGIVAVLAFFGMNPSAALSVALLDRFVSYWSVIAVGLVVFLLQRRT